MNWLETSIGAASEAYWIEDPISEELFGFLESFLSDWTQDPRKKKALGDTAEAKYGELARSK